MDRPCVCINSDTTNKTRAHASGRCTISQKKLKILPTWKVWLSVSGRRSRCAAARVKSNADVEQCGRVPRKGAMLPSIAQSAVGVGGYLPAGDNADGSTDLFVFEGSVKSSASRGCASLIYVVCLVKKRVVSNTPFAGTRLRLARSHVLSASQAS